MGAVPALCRDAPFVTLPRPLPWAQVQDVQVFVTDSPWYNPVVPFDQHTDR